MNKSFLEFKNYIKDKKTAVVGIGVSNRPLIDFLLKLGATVTAFDKKNEGQLGEVAEDLRSKGVQLVLGEDYLDKLKGFQVVFKTPSMRIDSPALVEARKEGAYITSEIEEFIRYCPAKVYGVTGSDGKTTTTTLIHNILKEQGYKTWVGGNIGIPLFANIEDMRKEDMVVLELSSFQLMTMTNSPDIAVVTNLSPNHLDMHKGMDEYIESKKNIFRYQDKKDLLILNRDNSITDDMTLESEARVLKFSVKEKIENGAYLENDNLLIKGKWVCKIEEIKIKGLHNVENILAAFAATYEDVTIESMRKVATTFTGVEHRCEFVRSIDGIEFYNDSIASSPTRTVAGLLAFEKPVILIAGGYDKKIPFEPLAEEGCSKIKALILMGNTRYKIKSAFDKYIEEKQIALPIIITDSLEEAIEKAKEISEEGDIITLSPACASFDMFSNFEVRGNRFKEIVNNL